MAACPWTKQSKTGLHYLVKSISSTLPSLSRIMVFMDDLFGYGPTKNLELLEKWWDLDIPKYGLDSRQQKDRAIERD